MPGKIVHEIARLLCGVLLAWMFLGRADKRRAAKMLVGGRVEFTPNWYAYCAWPLIVALVAWFATKKLIQSHGKFLEVEIAICSGLLAFEFLIAFPGMIIVSDNGLEQVYWFWKHKRIQWKDIAEINTGEKSRTITITGADGTKIVHSSRLPDRPRLLLELKQRCGENLPPDFPSD
jgi:hypothetical protein